MRDTVSFSQDSFHATIYLPSLLDLPVKNVHKIFTIMLWDDRENEQAILAGPQGLGKSTLLDKMSRGWFNDSIRTFEGKEASELLQGVWLVEISELDAFRRTDVARIKQFLSLRTDRFRAAYGRHVKELPRCCVFFGTTNTKDFLQDRTGNRRFWPVDVGVAPITKNVWTDLPGEIDQLWAEAKVRWQLGEPLYLSRELEEAAKVKQEEHREVSAREGIIMDFLGRQVPEDWQSWPLDRRRMFWAGSVQGDIKLVDRDRVCALEVWCEALDGRQKDMRYSDTAEINSILEAAAGWEKSIEIKLHDKVRALELLGKHLGVFATGGGAAAAEENNIFDVIEQSTREEIDTNDIPEIEPPSEPGDDVVE